MVTKSTQAAHPDFLVDGQSIEEDHSCCIRNDVVALLSCASIVVTNLIDFHSSFIASNHNSRIEVYFIEGLG
ncbi:hypothetical protein Pfo_021048 [Paulownia fortunei]|nr:hypothetical protein Pfo_021048 [Paulownia fortunei]